MRLLKLAALSAGVVSIAGSWIACGGDDASINDGADASVSDTGTAAQHDGSTHAPDASVDSGSDATVAPDGSTVSPDGSTHVPDASADGGGDATVAPDGATVSPGASVLQHHNHASRDGMYVDAILTKAAVATMHVDTSFTATIADGPVYAQPLYVEPGPGGKEVLVVATEQNYVYAFSAADGSVVWKTPQLAKPVTLASLKSDPGCGNIDPLGITGTPIIDLPSRTIFLDAMTTPDGGTTKKHMIYALDLDTGNVRTGWPIDVDAALASAPTPFKSPAQNQRGALALVDGILYVPYGGHSGDCGDYRGWVVSLPIANPKQVTGFATAAPLGGIWASGGPSSDGTSVFVTTGNTRASGTTWGQGDAVLRFTKGTTFTNQAADYYAPTNWKALDNADLDLGGAAAVPIDSPGSTPDKLILALGKDKNAYLMDRANLGGIGKEIGKLAIAGAEIKGAATVYKTPTATYAVFRGGKGVACTNGGTGTLVALTVKAGSPPTLQPSWCGTGSNVGSPMVTTTDGTANAIVWGTSGNSLTALDGDTGATLYSGGTVSGDVSYFNTPIAAKGRVFVVSSQKLYAFKP